MFHRESSSYRYFFRLIINIATAVMLLLPAETIAGQKFSVILTSNLNGRFSPTIEEQDEKDPMLLLAQSLIKEKSSNPFDLYLDLGNSFYPGPVSRYSFGSVMMDFFTYFNCSATVVSSRDISIGLTNLEFLSKGRDTKLLSANITRGKVPVFTPYFTVTVNKGKIGLIGITSAESLFDIADKKVLKISFSEYLDSIKEITARLKNEGYYGIVLLSGLSYRKNLELMQEIPDIDLVISGGDSSGKLFSVPASRVDLQWERSIITLPGGEGYYRLELDLSDKITVSSLKYNNSVFNSISDQKYNEFRRRLTLWKEKLSYEENRLINGNLPPSAITDESAAEILRHRYKTEIAILDKYSISPRALYGPVYSFTVMDIVNNDYPIFMYTVTGADLKNIIENSAEFIITGVTDSKVQNYPINDSRRYSVCSTQSAYDRICRILRKNIIYDNTWKTLRDEIESDISSEMVISKDSYDYLDNRFRMLIDITLSNFYDRSEVNRGETIETPPGQPDEKYTRWGMEDKINITIYNKYHQLVLTPYIYFIKQDDQYLQNLLRGTLLYTYNLNNCFKPYHKSQIDTVLVKDNTNKDGGRPILARETVGVSFFNEWITGKVGTGFEKQIQDPEDIALYGLETIVDAGYPITDELKYSFRLDSFISAESESSKYLKTRIEITNAVSYKINSLLGISLKYKWFRLYSGEIEESYRYSQMLLSLDIKTDFKLF